MADSETSTSLSIVPPTATISTGFRSAATSSGVVSGGSDLAARDPAIDAGRRWREAHDRTAALCRKQQRLEARLRRAVGEPGPLVAGRGQVRAVRILSLPGCSDFCEPVPAGSGGGTSSHLEPMVQQQRWQEADRAIGYSVALEEEARAAEAEDRLADILWSTRASSLNGMIAKLEAVVDSGEPKEGCSEFPWPQLRSVLADLCQLTPQTQQSSRDI